MYYAIISEDVENSLPLRQSARPAHIDRLQALKAEGRLLVAGPHPALETPEPGDAGHQEAHRSEPNDEAVPGEHADGDEDYEKADPEVVPGPLQHGLALYRHGDRRQHLAHDLLGRPAPESRR